MPKPSWLLWLHLGVLVSSCAAPGDEAGNERGPGSQEVERPPGGHGGDAGAGQGDAGHQSENGTDPRPGHDAGGSGTTPHRPDASVAASMDAGLDAGADGPSPGPLDASAGLDAAAVAHDAVGGDADSGDAGDTGGEDPDASTSDAGGDPPSDASTETCLTVCFEWAQDPEPVTPPDSSPTKFVYDDCNPWGSRRGECPDSFVCGNNGSWIVSGYTYEMPLCTRPAGMIEFTTDVSAGPVLAQPREVQLNFRLNGSPWPTSTATGAAAGTVTFVDKEQAGRTWTVDNPKGNSPLEIDLDSGVYDVYFSLSGQDFDATVYPEGSPVGVLTVVGSGSASVELEGKPIDYSLTLDGVSPGTLAGEEAVTVRFASEAGRSIVVEHVAGQSLSGAVVLPPGTYDVSAHFEVPEASGLPAGAGVVLAGLEVANTAPASLNLNLTTVVAMGSITVDGANIPDVSERGTVVLENELSTVRVPLTGTPASYTRRVVSGDYDVEYDATDTAMAGIPDGRTRVVAGHDASMFLSANAQTVDVSGTIRLNGTVGALPDSPTELAFQGLHAEATLPMVSGAYAGPVFAGEYELLASTSTSKRWKLADAWSSTTTPQLFDIEARELTLTLTRNGAPPPSNGTTYRGFAFFEAVDGPSAIQSVLMPASGSLMASVVLPTGQWSIRYLNTAGAYDGLPDGGIVLGAVTLGALDEQRTIDLAPVPVTTTVTLNGGEWPEATPGSDRGILYFYSLDGGSLQPHALPATGPIVIDTLLFPGIYATYYICSTGTCEVPGSSVVAQYVHSGFVVE